MSREEAKQLEFSNGYQGAKQRTDMIFHHVNHLLQHVSDGHQEAIEYWSKTVKREIVALSFYLEEADRIWRID